MLPSLIKLQSEEVLDFWNYNVGINIKKILETNIALVSKIWDFKQS
jgi:hypothetical protein